MNKASPPITVMTCLIKTICIDRLVCGTIFPFFPIGYAVSFIEDDMLKKKTLSIRSQRKTDNISMEFFCFSTKTNVKMEIKKRNVAFNAKESTIN